MDPSAEVEPGDAKTAMVSETSDKTEHNLMEASNDAQSLDVINMREVEEGSDLNEHILHTNIVQSFGRTVILTFLSS